MFRKRFCMVLVLLLVLSCFSGCGSKEEKGTWDEKALAMRDAFLEKVNPGFAYDIALELSEDEDLLSSSLGTRTAGSDAEHAAADFLSQQMRDIGLTDVEMVPVNVTKWQFNDATLMIDGVDKAIKPHSYATASTPAEGLRAEVVYVGDGTMQDYEGQNVRGKIVLVDIDQRNNWWITYPMLEAQYRGAAAILSANVGGFSQIDKDALNAQDICGPTAIPCLSISQNESEMIQNRLKDGPVFATLNVDNIVEPNGTSYNIIGKIKGNGESSQMIAIGSHYDMYFKGFQDNSCGVGLTLAMAKAMIDSGYQPNNDIVFILHGAEEWGSSYTQFDWSTGAYQMINEAHPEWAGNILTFINFELPAYEFADYTSMYSAPELYSRISKFVKKSPFNITPQNCFAKGVKTKGYQTYTYSDDFSYYAAGVPSVVNGFLLKEDMTTPFDFYIDRYHSQFDTSDTYNENVMDFNLRFYGSFAIYTDQSPALELDFTAQYNRIMDTLDENIATIAGADVAGLKDALESFQSAADAHHKNTIALNNEYIQKRNSKDTTEEELQAIRQKAIAMNEKTLAIFKYTQDELLGLMYERPIVPHEAPQENIQLINSTIESLNEGDIVTAADEYAWQINNVLEWYNMYFSPQVIDIQNDMFFGAKNQNNLYWGTGKMFTPANVEEATRFLISNYDNPTVDVSRPIAIYERAIVDQQAQLVDIMEQEIKAIHTMTEMLTEVSAL